MSAAAGSGKTAVLVERIIAQITEGEHPKDIDKLLVVTFTRAAAAEMRTRIGNALEKKLAEQPENEHLQKQASLLHTAQITTIDSFCQSIIRNYFHVIDLDPMFSVGDEMDLEIMKRDVLADLLEEEYAAAKEEKRSAFLKFTNIFSTGRTDRAVEDLILGLYDISTSYPWPEEWLADCIQMYQADSLEELNRAEWVRKLTEITKKYAAEYLVIAQKAYRICRDTKGLFPYEHAIKCDIEYLKDLEKARTYEELYCLFRTYNPANLGRVSDKEVPKEEKDLVKKLRERYKKNGIDMLKEKYFFQSPKEMLADLQAMAGSVKELLRLTQDFTKAFAEKKREEGIVDFADIEHFALDILVEKDGGRVRPSETARELQEYYEEILTDEYQDSNYVQELLLTSICRGPKKKPYLFMVGDVKQSIYKFRLARPDLFLNKYRRYSEDESKGKRIDLQQNFRSRASVLESANYIFEKIMLESFGGIRYDESARLSPGALFPEIEYRTAGKTEIILIDKKEKEGDLTGQALEAAVIGEKIRGMVNGEDPLYIMDKGTYRPARYGDIAILLRSIAGWSEDFIQVLNDMGIPAYADTRTGYFTSLEVATILNLLHVVDNPRQDIPLVAVLRSCLVGLTDDELGILGAMPPDINFWDRVKGFYQGNDLPAGIPEKMEKDLRNKLSVFLDRLEGYQEFAKTRSVYELLRKIFDETGFYQIMSAMPAGEKRKANLDILLQQAIQFAGNGHRGVYGFSRYIENLQKANVDFGEASINEENTDAVRIMTIHRSKGLEFPVVFVAGMGKQFNMTDVRKRTVLDGDYGVGCEYVDLALRTRRTTLAKQFITGQMADGIREEEIRILYVALTRAKEKLFLSGTASNIPSKMKKWALYAQTQDFCQIGSAQTYLDWIMPSVMDRGKALQMLLGMESGKFEDCIESSLYQLEIYSAEDVLSGEKEEYQSAEEEYQLLLHWNIDKVYNEKMYATLVKQENYVYSYQKETGLPVKVSVTELKRQAAAQAEKLAGEKEVYLGAAASASAWGEGGEPVSADVMEEGGEPASANAAGEGGELASANAAREGGEPVSMSAAREGEEPVSAGAARKGGEPVSASAAGEGEEPVSASAAEEGEKPVSASAAREGEEPASASAAGEGGEPIPRPAFLQDKKEMSGVAKGTLYHLVMEHYPYREIRKSDRKWRKADFQAYLGKMIEQGYLTKEEGALLNVGRFVAFADSGIGKRMAQAAENGTLRLEQPFMLGLKAREIYPESGSDELIMVQGIIDAFFYEGEEIVLVDYKTDFVKDGTGEELIKKYRAQLDYYARALERLTGKNVSEKIIYSFSLGKELILP